jgi:spore coat protein H
MARLSGEKTVKNRTWLAVLPAVAGCLLATPLFAGALEQGSKQVKDGKQDAPAEVFGPTKVLQFHLEFSAKEWDKMQQVRGGKGFGFPGGPKKDPEKPAEKPTDVHKSASFGMEYPWASATVFSDGKTYKNVGVRYKGNFTYIASASSLKRPLQIDLDHYDEGVRYHGLKKLYFSNGITDPTRGRETLALSVFRAAGVPAPRTAYAEVTLTVPGKYDKEYVGLYTFIEHVGSSFLKDHFKSAKGLLVKPEGLRSLDYLGEDWKPYEDRYRPKNEATKAQKERLIAFTKLVNKADDEQFRKEIGSYLDIDAFLRYLAVNGLVANLDSFLGMGHNYFIYLRPDTNKFVFIPWDLDLSMGMWPMAGPPEQQMDLSINHPHMGQNKLIDRLLAMPEVQTNYQKLLKELAANCFSKEKLLKDVEAITLLTTKLLAKEKKAVEARKEGPGAFGLGGKGGGMFASQPSLQTFVEKRTASVVAQLDGKSKGYVPTGMGFGPPGGKGGFGPGMFLAGPLLKEIDTNGDKKISPEELQAWVKQIFKDHDKDGKGIDDKAFAKVLVKLMPKFGPGGKGPPGGFDPAAMMAGQLVKAIDPKTEGKVSLETTLAAFNKFFKEWDKDKNGTLDEAELLEGLNRILGPPAGKGPGVPKQPAPDEKKAARD